MKNLNLQFVPNNTYMPFYKLYFLVSDNCKKYLSIFPHYLSMTKIEN